MGASGAKIQRAAGMVARVDGPAERGGGSEPESRRCRSGLLLRIGEPLSDHAACPPWLVSPPRPSSRIHLDSVGINLEPQWRCLIDAVPPLLVRPHDQLHGAIGVGQVQGDRHVGDHGDTILPSSSERALSPRSPREHMLTPAG